MCPGIPPGGRRLSLGKYVWYFDGLCLQATGFSSAPIIYFYFFCKNKWLTLLGDEQEFLALILELTSNFLGESRNET